MWHFVCRIWRCDHFCCGSLVLEIMPIFRFIGLPRRDLPFGGLKQQNLRTFVGHAWGARSHPGTQICDKYEFIMCLKNPNLNFFLNFPYFAILAQSSQIGDFGDSGEIWLLWWKKITRKPWDKQESPIYIKFGCPGSLGHPRGCPIEVRKLQLSMRFNRRSRRETPH